MYSSVSVDGFIADENDQPGPLFDWLSSGAVPLDETGVLKVSQTSYDYTRPYWDQITMTWKTQPPQAMALSTEVDASDAMLARGSADVSSLSELLKLPAGERAELAMALWESLSEAEREGEFELTPEEGEELDRRWSDHVQRPDSSTRWDDVRRRLMERE
jgi:putative addiction module component (TIGR02574 family)